MSTKTIRGYQTFDHTADVGLEIWGDTFNAIFEEAGKALFGLILDSGKVVSKESFAIQLSSESGEELFFSWLKELLYIFDTKKVLLSDFTVLNLDPWKLEAKVSGEKLDRAKHRLGHEVKAVTRHAFEFKKTKNGFYARIVLDI